MTCFFFAERRLGVLTRPTYLPFSSMTGKNRWRELAMVFFASSTAVFTLNLMVAFSGIIFARTGMDMQIRRAAA